MKKAKLFIYGHVGTCDLHGMWVAPVSMPLEERLKISKQAVQLEGDINLMWGSASGEIGQTALRDPVLQEAIRPGGHSMLMDIKRAVDPNNILNPGNLEGEGYE